MGFIEGGPPQQQLAGRLDQIRARVDQWYSKTFKISRHSHSFDEFPRTEYHNRPGQRIGFKSSEGRVAYIAGKNDILLVYDPLGRLTKRRVLKDLDKDGYVRMTAQELREYDQSVNWPSFHKGKS